MKKLALVFLVLLLLISTRPASAAIAFDASSTWTTGSTVTSTAISHTVGAGSNMILFALAFTTNNDASATYNGVSMTKILSQVGPDTRTLALFVLPNPATGTHNIVISVPSSEAIVQGSGISYSGAQQTALVDASAANTTSSNITSFSTTLTTIADNDWVVLGARISGTGFAAGASTTLRGSSANTAIGDTNGAKTPPGSQTMAVIGSGGGTAGAYTVMAAFAPAVAAPSSTDALFFAGD